MTYYYEICFNREEHSPPSLVLLTPSFQALDSSLLFDFKSQNCFACSHYYFDASCASIPSPLTIAIIAILTTTTFTHCAFACSNTGQYRFRSPHSAQSWHATQPSQQWTRHDWHLFIVGKVPYDFDEIKSALSMFTEYSLICSVWSSERFEIDLRAWHWTSRLLVHIIICVI